MASYPNQKHFTIHRINPIKENKQYLAITRDNLTMAARTLKGDVAFKFYLYLAANVDNYDFYYSPQHFANVYGVSIDSARRAADKLIEAGYLVKDENNKNGFEFFETPQNKRIKITDTVLEKKKLIPQDNGELLEMTFTEVYNELKENYPIETIREYWDSIEEAQ